MVFRFINSVALQWTRLVAFNVITTGTTRLDRTAASLSAKEPPMTAALLLVSTWFQLCNNH